MIHAEFWDAADALVFYAKLARQGGGSPQHQGWVLGTLYRRAHAAVDQGASPQVMRALLGPGILYRRVHAAVEDASPQVTLSPGAGGSQ